MTLIFSHYSIPFRLFDEWKGLDVSHSLTVVFFSRTFITPNSQNQGLNILEHDFETAQKDSEGRLYEVSMEILPRFFATLNLLKLNFIKGSLPSCCGEPNSRRLGLSDKNLKKGFHTIPSRCWLENHIRLY